MTRIGGLLLLFLAASLVVGCGGGGGGGQESGPSIDPQAIDVLRAAGLTIIYSSDKDTYQKGETVHFWLSIRNDSSSAHSIEVHSKGDGLDTYEFFIWGGYTALWANDHYDTPSWQIQPGQTVKLFDVEWNQTTNAGAGVDPGQYLYCTEIFHVWLDGKQTSPLPLELDKRIAIE